MSEDGRFVIAWEASGIDSGGDYGVFAQRYSASDAPQNGEFHVNTAASSDRVNASVTMDNQGDFVVVWSGSGIDDSDGIFCRVHD
jgi:hypothetical protein